MGESAVLPAKSKKKKRSFFDDDDFFVIKKTKSKQRGPSLPSKQPATEDQKLDEHDVVASDDLQQSFHSARDSLSDEEAQKPEADAQVQIVDVVELEVDDATGDVNIVDPAETDDDPDTALSRFFKGISSGPTPENANSEESKRVYTVRMRSEVYDLDYEVEVAGAATFQSVLLDVLAIRGIYPDPYADDVMMWVEGKSELKSFFKPDTLRIPPPPYGAPTNVTVLHMYRSQLPEIDLFYSQYGQADTEEDVGDTLVVEVEERTKEESEQSPDDRGAYFVIGLKGKDNKRIECEVSAETRIRDLLNYYLKVKGLSKVTKPKLVFDDEVLDLDGKVGDTELEEDFEVEVYV